MKKGRACPAIDVFGVTTKKSKDIPGCRAQGRARPDGKDAARFGSGTMLSRILTVGGLTLLSRVTGFARDIMLAAILGAGPVADAFFVALRLPNHFRAIFT